MELRFQYEQGDEWKEVTAVDPLAAFDFLTTIYPYLASDAFWRAVSSSVGPTGPLLYVDYDGRNMP